MQMNKEIETHMNKKVIVAGSNYYGQCAKENNNTETPFSFLTSRNKEFIDENIYYITCNESTTWFMAESGNVWRCGLNSYNQLGCSVANNSSVSACCTYHPQKVDLPGYHIREYGVYCGAYITVLLTNNREQAIFCGKNDYGASGTRLSETKLVLTPVPAEYLPEHVEYAVVGTDFVAYKCHNEGYHYYFSGSLNDGKNFENIPTRQEFNYGKIKQMAAAQKCIMILNTKGRVYVKGHFLQSSFPHFTLVDEMPSISRMFVKNESALFQTVSRELYGYGKCQYKQLLSDTTTCEKPTLAAVTNLFETIDTIAMGGQHIALTTVDGCTYVIGWDGNGQLGRSTGSVATDIIPYPSFPSLLQAHLPFEYSSQEEEIAAACGGYATVFYVRKKRRTNRLQQNMYRSVTLSRLVDLDVHTQH